MRHLRGYLVMILGGNCMVIVGISLDAELFELVELSSEDKRWS